MTVQKRTSVEIFLDENHDCCTQCGKRFEDTDQEVCVAGYDAEGGLINSCKGCEHKVAQVIHRKSYYARPYETPSYESPLWRYMDFAKYVSLLSTSSLYFAAACTFEDLFEGAQGLKANKGIWDAHYLDFFTKVIKSPPGGGICTDSEGEINNKARELLAQREAIGNLLRERNYVSCWHENHSESEAMWRLYSGHLENAVAIRTTYKDLSASIARSFRRNIQIGRVRYIDYKTRFSGVNNALWRKNVSFSHENEVRAVYCDLQNPEPGKLIGCDLNRLIRAVHVSPKSPQWLKRTINSVNEKYGLPVGVSDSELLAEPFY